MDGVPSRRQPAVGDAAVLAALAAFELALHVSLSGRYGYWIDELYFIACGDHLDWGYVDHPPLIAAVARGSRLLLGDSLFAIRFLPALAGALLVFLTGWMARALGGGRVAQIVAAVAVLAVPVYQLFAGLLTMNAFEPLLWMTCAYLAILVASGQSPLLWLVFGAVTGIGLLNKHSIAFFVAALAAGLLLSPQRSLLRGRWPWLGAALALVLVSPHVVWQWQHGWPTVELLANAHRYQHQPVTPLEFLWGQVQIVHPFTLPLWLAGLYFFLIDARGRRFRFLGWAFAVLFTAFLWIQAKTYYLAPIYPMLFAAGAIEVETLARRSGRTWIPKLAVALLVVGGCITAPYVLPILPLPAIPTYMRLLGLHEVRSETRPMGDVPQIFADMLAWDELVAAVARVYDGLPPEERQRAVIWGNSYGSAAAVDYLGPKLGLPKAISGHQNYYLWGAGPHPRDVWIAIGFDQGVLSRWFDRVELVDAVRCESCMPDRRLQPIFVCRGLRAPVEKFWPLVKCWTCDRPAFASTSP